MAHRKDNPNRRGSLTLNERQRLRKNKKYGWNFIYRNGIKIDGKGYPINDRSSSVITDPTDPNYDPFSEGAGDEGPAELTEAEMKSYIWGFEKYGWDYIYRDGVKTDKEGNPMEEDEPVYSDDTIDYDPVTDKYADEPGYKDPTYVAPDTSDPTETTQADIDFMMDDANYDIGGNLNETNTDTGENIENVDIGGGVAPAGEVFSDSDDDGIYDEGDVVKEGYGGRGYAQRTKGYNPFLKIKKKTKGLKGAFTRGSLRVKKLSGMTI